MSIMPIQLSPEQQRKYDQMYAQAMQEGRPWTYDEHMSAIMAAQTEDFQNRYPDEWRRAQEVNPEDGILYPELRGPKKIDQNQPKQPDSYYPPNWNNRPTKPQPDIYPPDIWNDFPTKPPDWGTDYPGPFTYPESAPVLIPGAEEWIKPTPQGSPSKMYSNLQNAMQQGQGQMMSNLQRAMQQQQMQSQLQNNKFFSYLQNSMQKKRNNQY